MNWEPFAVAVGGFAIAIIFGSLVEYVVHIGMHRRYLLGKIHTQHHKDGTGDGWFWEFLAYSPAALLFGGIAAVVVWQTDWLWFPVGFAVGGLCYAAFAAYAHQLQHEWPELVFWMRMPVHHVHHVHHQWRVNFGIGLDIWDRVFGTYERVNWQPDPVRKRKSVLDFFRIKWV
jgi:sterol desaturase/sphingolipid hydroxylase (fatty acid hydroxylase superfamily)